MTSINVAKGLFRVWVLFALCWVVPATVIQFDNLTSTQVGYYDPQIIGYFDPIKYPRTTKWDDKLSIVRNMKDVTITFQDEKKHKYINVPEDVKSEDVYTRALKDFKNLKVIAISRSESQTVFSFEEVIQFDAESAKLCKEASNSIGISVFCDKWESKGSVAVTAPIWSKRVRAAEWLMLPPLVLLLLGYGVLWAVRGFKA